METVPVMRSVVTFILGFALVLTATEGSLWALVTPASDMHDRVNLLRHERHLIPLRASDKLSAVAQRHAEDMVERGYFSHTSPSGTSPLDRVQAAGINGFRLLAENLGASSVAAPRVPLILEAWLDSPVHRENLLNPAFNTSGIGSAEASDGRTLVVQLYASFPKTD